MLGLSSSSLHYGAAGPHLSIQTFSLAPTHPTHTAPPHTPHTPWRDCVVWVTFNTLPSFTDLQTFSWGA